MTDKDFKSHKEQVEILRARGLSIKNIAWKTLAKENYYNVINGYKDLFLDPKAKKERYKNQATFDEIYALYLFDRELRFIFLKTLLRVENHIKSVISYRYAEMYGHGYLKLINFKPYRNNKELQEIMGVISTLQKAISDQSGKHTAVTHYVTEYGFVPIWVLANVLTLGNISKFYGVLKLNDRQAIAKEFGLPENVFRNHLRVISMYRNICAHDERLYNVRLEQQEMKSVNTHEKLKIAKDAEGKYIYGTNDLFSLMICLKELLPQTKRGEFSSMVDRIDREITELSKKLSSVKKEDILHAMGFPRNWREIKRKMD